jgi:ABC-type amino acid transport substrate-binding protein
MRRLVPGAVVVAIALSGTAALACGDKLLAIGRGVRFQHGYAARQGNLVIYSARTRSGATLSTSKLEATLRRAGHKLQIVDGDSQLDEALKSGKVDVVLVDFADLARITRLLQLAPSKPVILPILFKPSKPEFAAAQKEYRFALKTPADDDQYLAAIDEAMKLRVRTGAKS